MKELKVRKSASPGLFEAYYEGGGELPTALKGKYTSPRDAKQAINDYENSKPKPKRKTVKKEETEECLD